MSDTHETESTAKPNRLGLLAQFAGPAELLEGAEKFTDAGYRRVDAYSPFAIIGIDDALKARGTVLPWIVFSMGFSGLFLALAMQLYMNGVEIPGVPWGLSGYDFQISGKPGFSSLPAFIPVTFEVIVLLSAFGSFFGMLALNRLPTLSNPLFRNERFASATTDGFFLFVEASDPKYAEAETAAMLTSVGATAVDPIDEPVTGHAVPGMLYLAGAVAGCVALLPPLYLWTTSSTTSTLPRISIFKDMESQAKFKAQTTNSLFADGRSARPPVVGTVGRGDRTEDSRLYYGVEEDQSLTDLFRGDAPATGRRVPARFVADGGDAPAGGDAQAADGAAPAADGVTGEVEKNWSIEFPESLKLDADFMDRGEQRFNIHCAVCHGLAGNGDGLVSKRASQVSGASWQVPTNLHIEAVTVQPIGRIFDTISNGRRRMPGYREHITPEDRWAIVLYLKALQRSQAATLDDVPTEKRRELSSLN